MCSDCDGALSESPTNLEVHDEYLCRCGGSSEYEVTNHLIKLMGCERFIPLIIAVAVVIIEIPVSGDQGILALQELRLPILGMCSTFRYPSFSLYCSPRLLTGQRHIRRGSAHH